jgi:hypothetical protein
LQPARRPTWICPWREAILPIGGTSPGLVPNKIRPTGKALRRSTAARGDELEQRVWESLDRAVDGSQYDHEPYCVDGHTEVTVRGGTPYGSRSVSSCSASLHTKHPAVQHSTCLRSGQSGHSGQWTWQAGTRRPRKSLATRIPGATAEANLIQYRPAVPHLPADAVANAIRGSSKVSGHAGGPHSTVPRRTHHRAYF